MRGSSEVRRRCTRPSAASVETTSSESIPPSTQSAGLLSGAPVDGSVTVTIQSSRPWWLVPSEPSVASPGRASTAARRNASVSA